MSDPVVTLALSVRNDYPGLFFTINSALLSVKNTSLEGLLAFSVVNDSDNSQMASRIAGYCHKQNIPCLSEFHGSNHWGRNEAVRRSKTEFTVLADAHVLFAFGFFGTYVDLLRSRQDIGLIHSPFTCGGVPSYRACCFYNLQRFHLNLHGTFSHRGAEMVEPYPVALAPHAAYGFRTKQWLDFGGYIDECQANGGGEPFVTYKYWMFGSSAWLTPKTNFIHMTLPVYHKSLGWWKRNHVITAFALGGWDVGVRYGRVLRQHDFDAMWRVAGPYYRLVERHQRFRFDELLDYFKAIKARPFI